MAIQEYSVHDDFFQVDEQAIGEFDFPCCLCTHRKNATMDKVVCNVCGHNPSAEEHYRCVLCGIIELGAPEDEDYIARGTKSQIGPLCSECIIAVSEDIGKR